MPPLNNPFRMAAQRPQPIQNPFANRIQRPTSVNPFQAPPVQTQAPMFQAPSMIPQGRFGGGGGFNQPSMTGFNGSRIPIQQGPEPKQLETPPTSTTQTEQQADDEFLRRYQESMQNPYTSQYQQALQEAPTREEYAPSKKRRLGAILAGFGAGLQGGFGGAFNTAKGITEQPYADAQEEYRGKLARLSQAQQAEQGNIQNKLATLGMEQNLGERRYSRTQESDRIKRENEARMFEQGIKQKELDLKQQELGVKYKSILPGNKFGKPVVYNAFGDTFTEGPQTDLTADEKAKAASLVTEDSQAHAMSLARTQGNYQLENTRLQTASNEKIQGGHDATKLAAAREQIKAKAIQDQIKFDNAMKLKGTTGSAYKAQFDKDKQQAAMIAPEIDNYMKFNENLGAWEMTGPYWEGDKADDPNRMYRIVQSVINGTFQKEFGEEVAALGKNPKSTAPAPADKGAAPGGGSAANAPKKVGELGTAKGPNNTDVPYVVGTPFDMPMPNGSKMRIVTNDGINFFPAK